MVAKLKNTGLSQFVSPRPHNTEMINTDQKKLRSQTLPGSIKLQVLNQQPIITGAAYVKHLPWSGNHELLSKAVDR